MAKIRIDINSSLSAEHLQDAVERVGSDNPHTGVQEIINLLRKMSSQGFNNTVTVQTGRAAASGTVTCANVQAADTVTIQGQAFTAVASGASTNQFNIGVKATKVLQDITYTAVNPGTAGNSITIAYTVGGTAGSEVVSVIGNAISVQIEDGVSTATQVKAAYDAEPLAVAKATSSISGTAGNAQVAAVASAFSGGTGTDTLSASSLVSAINANATIAALMSASSSLGVVTLTAVEEGALSNQLSLATSNGTRLAKSGTALAGGADDSTPKVFVL